MKGKQRQTCIGEGRVRREGCCLISLSDPNNHPSSSWPHHPSTSQTLAHVTAPALLFNIISFLPRAPHPLPRRREKQRWGRWEVTARACFSLVEEEMWRRWRPHLRAWLSPRYNQTGAIRSREECLITFNPPWLTRDNAPRFKGGLASNRSLCLVIHSGVVWWLRWKRNTWFIAKNNLLPFPNLQNRVL